MSFADLPHSIATVVSEKNLVITKKKGFINFNQIHDPLFRIKFKVNAKTKKQPSSSIDLIFGRVSMVVRTNLK